MQSFRWLVVGRGVNWFEQFEIHCVRFSSMPEVQIRRFPQSDGGTCSFHTASYVWKQYDHIRQHLDRTGFQARDSPSQIERLLVIPDMRAFM